MVNVIYNVLHIQYKVIHGNAPYQATITFNIRDIVTYNFRGPRNPISQY